MWGDLDPFYEPPKNKTNSSELHQNTTGCGVPGVHQNHEHKKKLSFEVYVQPSNGNTNNIDKKVENTIDLVDSKGGLSLSAQRFRIRRIPKIQIQAKSPERTRPITNRPYKSTENISPSRQSSRFSIQVVPKIPETEKLIDF